MSTGRHLPPCFMRTRKSQHGQTVLALQGANAVLLLPVGLRLAFACFTYGSRFGLAGLLTFF